MAEDSRRWLAICRYRQINQNPRLARCIYSGILTPRTPRSFANYVQMSSSSSDSRLFHAIMSLSSIRVTLTPVAIFEEMVLFARCCMMTQSEDVRKRALSLSVGTLIFACSPLPAGTLSIVLGCICRHVSQRLGAGSFGDCDVGIHCVDLQEVVQYDEQHRCPAEEHGKTEEIAIGNHAG